MWSSFARSVLGPPAYGESLSPAQWAVVGRVRFVVAVMAIGIDLLLWWTLRDSDRVDRATVVWFVSINIPILIFVAATGFAQLATRHMRSVPLVVASVIAEGFAVVVWVQATGSLTSYFVITALVLVVWYRLFVGFAASAALTVSLLAFHGGAIVLEILGVLEPEPLFLGAPGPEYSEAGYQAALIFSLAAIYIALFIGTNAVVNKLREKDVALAEVRRAAQHAAERLRHGRLTGTLLAEEYALGELLGRGGMGEVYIGRRVSDEAAVAVKVLHSHLLTDEVALERFRREAIAGARVPERYVAKLLAVGRDEPRALDYIAMQYLRGEDMGAYLRRKGQMPVEPLCSVIACIAEALDAAHAAGIVHRDLKPQNVFLVDCDADKWPQIRLLDFGMSKLAASEDTTLTKTHAVIGTIAFMSPEQALGNAADVGPASDRFALAAIAYRALTGRLPFTSPDLLRAINEIANVHPPPPSSLRPEVNRDVDAVFSIGLAKPADARYESAQAFAEDLAAALRGTLSAESRNRARITADAGSEETITAIDND